jgi:hypothetical protein
VYSISANQAVTGGSIKVKVDPDGKLFLGFIPTAFGEAAGIIGGFAGQGTLNASFLGDGPKLRTDGHTGGIAGQGSYGSFAGGAWAISGPDYDYKENVQVGNKWRKWVCRGTGSRCRETGHWIYKNKGLDWKPNQHSGWELYRPIYKCVRVDVDSKAGAGAGASIVMNGSSYSESFRYYTSNDGVREEGMGTFVGSETTILTNGYNYDWGKGLGSSGSFINGQWSAKGVAYSQTQIGGAKATAAGLY